MTRDREMHFEKIENCRDFGGMKTSCGSEIQSGMLIRSAHLAKATDADIKKLREEYRLKKVVDLRTSRESTQAPDVKPDHVSLVSIPIFDETLAGISHEKEADDALAKGMIPEMKSLYRMMATNEICRSNLGRAVQTIMEHDFTTGSILWHCTEGKDRCGLVSAMLLMALSVDRTQILKDYLLTNETNEQKAEMYYQKILTSGQGETIAAAVKDAFLAKESYLNEVFSVIDAQYQDEETYLIKGLNIPSETIDRFRKKVLYQHEK